MTNTQRAATVKERAMNYTDWNGFRIEHCPRQQISYASLLDERGLFASPAVVLDADGADHADDIYDKIEDWLMDRASADDHKAAEAFESLRGVVA